MLESPIVWLPQFAGAKRVRVLIVGDTHSKDWSIDKVCETARMTEADLILQVGDFGFGLQGFDEWGMCNYVKKLAAATPVQFAFIDGNHDNHWVLQEMIQNRPMSPTPLLGNVTYLPRGSIFSVAGHRVVCAGGAITPDRGHRTEGIDFWPEENLRSRDIANLEMAWNASTSPSARATLLLTHDAPNTRFIIKYDASREGMYPPDMLQASRGHRHLIDEIRSIVKPIWHVHGHWHMRYLEGNVMGLAHSHMAMNDYTTVLDLGLGEEPTMRYTSESLYGKGKT